MVKEILESRGSYGCCKFWIIWHAWQLADVLARTSILVTGTSLSGAAQCLLVFSLEVLSENLGIPWSSFWSLMCHSGSFVSHERVKVKLSLWFVIMHLAALLLKQPFLSALAHHSCCCTTLSNMLLFYGFR